MENTKKTPKIIVRIKGGLGNQLFAYAAARRLAIVNQAELVIDDVTGFSRDLQYQRRYGLDQFSIPIRKATSSERLEPFERYRRGMLKWISGKKPFLERSYLEQEGIDFDRRLLDVKVSTMLYLDGLWQSENYFKDIEQIIREDLRITPPEDAENLQMAAKIAGCNGVALHVRWFEDPNSAGVHNLSIDYYQKAIALIEQKVDSPHYFLFSDNPAAAAKKINLPERDVTFVSHNLGDKNAYADLWLMSQCQHFITANSTFSWWAAWLGNNSTKVITTPLCSAVTEVTAWNFDGLIPENWHTI
jgi:Glycosyl transferase family 11